MEEDWRELQGAERRGLGVKGQGPSLSFVPKQKRQELAAQESAKDLAEAESKVRAVVEGRKVFMETPGNLCFTQRHLLDLENAPAVKRS
jgi:hypothetical protein